ncbi:transposase, partial [Stagnimonas aquatica]
PYPGSMIHLDIKTLGRFAQPGHRVTGNRRQDTPKAGKECIHVCVDDASRLAYVEVLPNEKQGTTTRFLLRALRWLRGLGVRVERVLTDNGSAYRSKTFAKACRRLRIKHKRTRPYTPRTNKPCCGSGLTRSPTTPQTCVMRHCQRGSVTTTSADLMPRSTGNHRSAESPINFSITE